MVKQGNRSMSVDGGWGVGGVEELEKGSGSWF